MLRWLSSPSFILKTSSFLFFLIYLFKFLSVLFSFSFQKTVEEMIKDLKDEEISELKRYGMGKQC